MEEKKKITGDESIYDPNALTVRTYIAMTAMGGFLQNGNYGDAGEIVALSVQMADKLITELNK